MFLRAGKCRPCSQCGQYLYISNACTIYHDTVCDLCSNPSAIKNLNFRLKCFKIQIDLLRQRFPNFKNEIYQAEPIDDYLTESLVSVSVSKPLNYNITLFDKNVTILMRSKFLKYI